MSNCVDVKQGHMSVIDAQLHSLRRLQSRVTGSPSHRKLIEQIAAELSELGLPVARDEHRFTRWLVPGKDHLQLFIGDQAVEVASAYPYSGATGAAGVSGRLVR